MANSLYTLCFIVTCLLIGYAINFAIGGLPASLYGMVTFTLILHLRICDASRVKSSISWGIKNMGVCFVPAGVGIINHYQLIKTHGLMLVVITFISTFLILTFVGLTFQCIENKNKSSQ
ncbi:MAG: CidA/LrgA family protein [Colwelliaceae bacterium]|jgi:holin-like protein|nr:CidA/LrgA family protein [Colwelliaceae bacterium]